MSKKRSKKNKGVKNMEEKIITEEPVEEMVEEVAEEPVEEGVVMPILLNVRNLANKESEIVRVLNKNDKVKIIGTENDFFIVELSDGLIGYCVKDFIARNN